MAGRRLTLEDLEEDWLSRTEAIELINNRFPGASIGKCEAILRAACASGEVRMLVFEEHLDVDKGYNKDDLAYWLGQQGPPEKPQAKPVGKGKRAAEAIEALWPAGIPAALANKVLCSQVIDWIKNDCDKQQIPFVDISDDTILRQAGRA
jgi:hypothetical protein